MTIELQRDIEEIAGRLRESTVAVRSQHGRGSGSGVIWAAAGTIVTNAHVALSRSVEIELADGRCVTGRVERRDEARDLAVINVNVDNLAAAQVRSAATLRVGEVLVAFGHPLGVRNVLTTGIAFGPHRRGEDRFVRADLRLEPGNSGGALADARGQVVGINSMIANGLALAIASDDVRRFLGEARESPRLGVRLAPVDAQRAQTGRQPAYAVLAVEPGSAAERSGIIIGDIILTRTIGGLAAATNVRVLRGGVALTLPIERADGGIAAAA